MAKTETWVLVADAAGARVLRADAETRRLELLRTYPHQEGRAKPSDLVVDRPGRSFDSNRAGGRHAMEPDTDVKRAELHRFAHELAGELDAAAAADRFHNLVIVAGPRLMGELRRALPERVAVRIRHEIGKDLAGLDVPQLATQIAPVLWP
jgi:protein required for attachment to host cells